MDSENQNQSQEPSGESSGGAPASDRWLSMARDAYEQSTTWFDVSLRPTVEKAMAHFGNRHAPGSKYHRETYKFRSKSFRPKTRASIRRNEAAAAVAFFSTQDMVSCAAEDSSNPKDVISAMVLSEIVNYRLDDSIPWFQTLVGAYQDALNVGVCISHQYWDFDEDVRQEPIQDHLTGGGLLDTQGQPITREVRHVLTDKPVIDLVAIENFRISPASDWRDPCGTSPYIVEMIPMFIGDVLEKMDAGVWFPFTEGEIQTAAQNQYDSIRAAREGSKRADSAELSHATATFDTVWIHRNIIREGGEDFIFYTLGTHERLSDPVPLRKEYRHLRRGERPYVMGSCVIETHKSYPAGLNELTFGLQEDTNEIQNQRRDNVSLVMNKRYFARRGATIDFKSLTRNVPGSVTLVDDINGDIRWDSPPDVTGSSYQEHDRASIDFDEIAGTFSPGSVQSNRTLSETVGGMQMLSNDANVITEYQIRVFAETWVEPVLKQLVRMEQFYETDDKVMLIAGTRAQYFEKAGTDKMSEDVLQGMVSIQVNVGFGATNPTQRIEKLKMGLSTVAGFKPEALQDVSAKEVIIEVFGALGYKSAERFFPNINKEGQEDPQITQLKQALQAAQQEIQSRTAGATIQANARQAVASMTIEADKAKHEAEMSFEQQRMAFEADQNERDRQNKLAVAVIDERMKSTELTSAERQTLDKIKASLAQTSMKLATTKDLAVGQHAVNMSKANSGQPVSKPVISPAVEPPQRAEPGRSFEQ